MGSINADFVKGIQHSKQVQDREMVKQKGSGKVSGIYPEAVAAGLVTGAIGVREGKKELFKRKMSQGRKKKLKLSFENRPTTLEENLHGDKVKQGRRAVLEHKADMQKAAGIEMTTKNGKRVKQSWRQSGLERKLSEMPQGVDAFGQVKNGMFVKEAKRDSVVGKHLRPSAKKNLRMKKYNGFGVGLERKGMVNRAVLQTALDQDGADTLIHRSKKGSRVTIAQELIGDLDHAQRADFRSSGGKNLVNRAGEKGVILHDLHLGNVGANASGKLKVRDVGHSVAGDLEKLTTEKKMRDIVKKRNVMSPYNKKLTLKMAKEAGSKFRKGIQGAGLKSIPYLGYGLAAYTALKQNPAQAMYDLEPSGSTVLTPQTTESRQHFKKQRTYNAKRKFMKLEQAEREYSPQRANQLY